MAYILDSPELKHIWTIFVVLPFHLVIAQLIMMILWSGLDLDFDMNNTTCYLYERALTVTADVVEVIDTAGVALTVIVHVALTVIVGMVARTVTDDVALDTAGVVLDTAGVVLDTAGVVL